MTGATKGKKEETPAVDKNSGLAPQAIKPWRGNGSLKLKFPARSVESLASKAQSLSPEEDKKVPRRGQVRNASKLAKLIAEGGATNVSNERIREYLAKEAVRCSQSLRDCKQAKNEFCR